MSCHELALWLTVLYMAAPVVSVFSVGLNGNAPSTGGLPATAFGLGFASFDATPTAAVASVGCATSSWISRTAVECRMASGGESKAISITVAAVTGTLGSLRAFTFNGSHKDNGMESGNCVLRPVSL